MVCLLCVFCVSSVCIFCVCSVSVCSVCVSAAGPGRDLIEVFGEKSGRGRTVERSECSEMSRMSRISLSLVQCLLLFAALRN